MIKVQELRVGNLVKHGESIIEVEYHHIRIQTFVNADFANSEGKKFEGYEPISITEKWLIDIGFEPELMNADSPNNRFMVYRKYPLTYNTNHGWWYESKQLKVQPEFVHQLQNLWDVLNGTELIAELSR